MPLILSTAMVGSVKIFGAKLKRLRDSKYKSQDDVARAVGVASGRVGAWEQSEITGMTRANFGKIADFFEIDPEELKRRIGAPDDAVTSDMQRRQKERAEREAEPVTFPAVEQLPSAGDYIRILAPKGSVMRASAERLARTKRIGLEDFARDVFVLGLRAAEQEETAATAAGHNNGDDAAGGSPAKLPKPPTPPAEPAIPQRNAAMPANPLKHRRKK